MTWTATLRTVVMFVASHGTREPFALRLETCGDDKSL